MLSEAGQKYGSTVMDPRWDGYDRAAIQIR